MRQSNIPGVVGLIDCTHIPRRNSYFSINVQAICDLELKFTNGLVRWRGSIHDSRFFLYNSNICVKFERSEIYGILLGDNGYPLRYYLITPLLTANPRRKKDKLNLLYVTRVKN